MIFVNFLVIAGCAYGIIISSIRKTEITNLAKELISQYDWIPPQVADFTDLAPTIVLSASNGLINPIARALTKFENWDYKNDMVNQQIWRMWIGKMLNLLIFVIFQFQLAT